MAVTTQNTAVSGWASKIAAAKETTSGTPVTSGAVYPPFEQAQIALANKLITRTPVRGSKAEALPGFGLYQVDGTMTLKVDPDSFGLFAALAMGSDTVTAGSGATAGTNSHLLKLGAQSTATFQADYGKNSVAQYTGCKFSGMDISCKPGEDLTSKFTFMGQGVTLLASQSLTPTYTNKNPFEWAFIQSTTIDGSAVDFSDFTVSLKNNLKAMWTSTSGRAPRGFNELGAAVSGSFTYPYKDDTINALLWGTNSGPASGAGATGHTILIPFTYPVMIGATTVPYSILITLNNCVIADAPIAIQAKNEVMQQVKFTAAESAPGAADPIAITLVNATSAAYV